MSLPKISLQQNQEINSRNRFRDLVPTDMFILRDEREHDFGVDFVLEAIQNSEFPTNFRSYVQLKSTKAYSENSDGTISYRKISTININYLLNQLNSIYVVYFTEKDCFFWEWVNVIKDYALNKKIDLDPSSEFTYRFSKQLDINSFKDIHQSLINLGRNLRGAFEKSSNLDKFRNNILLGDFSIESQDLLKDYREQKYEKILLHFSDKTEVTSQEAILIAICYYNLYNYKDGLFFVENELQKHPDDIDLLTLKACLLCESGIEENSITKLIMSKDIFADLLDKDNSYVNYYNLGNICGALSENTEAIAAYQKAIELKPDYEMAWKNLGTIYYHQKDYKNASNCFDMALYYNPFLPEALFSKGSLLLEFNEYDDALVFYNRVIENESFVRRCPSILYWKAYVLYRQNLYEEALNTIDLYIIHKSDDLYGMYLKAQIYSELKHQNQGYKNKFKLYLENIFPFFSDKDWILIELFALYVEDDDIDNIARILKCFLENHNIYHKVHKSMLKQIYKSKYLLTFMRNLDLYIRFRKTSNIDDFVFIMLSDKINPYELFWLPHGIAFCKSVDVSRKIKSFTKKSLAKMFGNILDYVEEYHLLLIKYISIKYYLLDNEQKSTIISSCLVYISDVWLRESARIFSWICNENKVPSEIADKAIQAAMMNFKENRFIEYYLKEFNDIWKWSKED